MELTPHGSIMVDGCTVRNTKDGRWLVSRSGIDVGYADSLAEVPSLIERQRNAVRERLARLNNEAAQRKADADARKATVEAASKAENTCAPNHEPTPHCPECRHLV
tara:strand:+ start:305 stop:622 length:318 start_codon:yes stop_codon:yes gene_type:complete